METVEGDVYIRQFSKWLRAQERRLANAPVANGQRRVVSTGSFLQSMVGNDTKALTLQLDLHHLAYLLLRFEESKIIPETSIGPLDWDLDFSPTRPLSRIAILSALPPDAAQSRNRSDALSFVSGFSWFSNNSGSANSESQIPAEIKYLYSAFTKLPSLQLNSQLTPPQTPSPLHKFVASFETLPDSSFVPLYAFKNLTHLVIVDLDPRCLLGWDVLAENLRNLEVRDSGMDSLDEWLVDSVRSQADWRANGKKAIRNITSNEEATKLPPIKWRQLRRLALPSNFLATISPEPWPNFQSLVSLDLSSNLLVSIPSGLSELVSLRSLNLSDNMIETLNVLSIGAISTLNLAKNRLTALSGLEKLKNLDSIDVTDNQIEDAGEVGRLVQLPKLRVLWAAEGNPFAAKEIPSALNPFSMSVDTTWRMDLFVMFAQVGNEAIQLDGAQPSWLERRQIAAEVLKRPKLSPRTRRTGSHIIDAETVTKRVNGRRDIYGTMRPPRTPRTVSSPTALFENDTADVPPLPTRPKSPQLESPNERPVAQKEVAQSDQSPASPSTPVPNDAESGNAPMPTFSRKSTHTRAVTETVEIVQTPKKIVKHRGETATLGRHSARRKHPSAAAIFNQEAPKDDTLNDAPTALRDKIARLRRDYPDNWLQMLSESESK